MAMVGRSCEPAVQSAAVFLFLLAAFASGVCAGAPRVQTFTPTSPLAALARRSAAATDLTCGGPSSWDSYLKTNYRGNDLKKLTYKNLPSGGAWTACANECMKNCNCRGIVVSAKVNNTETCWLKTGMPDFFTAVGLDSYVRTCTSDVFWRPFPRRDSPGNDSYSMFIPPSFSMSEAFDGCATLCASDCKCRGFTLTPYGKNGQYCNVKEGLAVESKLTSTNTVDLYAKIIRNPPSSPPPSVPCASPRSPPRVPPPPRKV